MLEFASVPFGPLFIAGDFIIIFSGRSNGRTVSWVMGRTGPNGLHARALARTYRPGAPVGALSRGDARESQQQQKRPT